MSNIVDNRWSSKFILPEHNRALLNFEQTKKCKERPLLDEQQKEYLDYRINEAINTKKLIRITVYGEYEDRAIEGEITLVDLHKGQIVVKGNNGNEGISINDIMSIGVGI